MEPRPARRSDWKGARRTVAMRLPLALDVEIRRRAQEKQRALNDELVELVETSLGRTEKP